MKSNKGEVNVKLIVGILILIIIACVIAFFLKGCNGFGFGNGNGIGIGNVASNDDGEKNIDENTTSETVTTTEEKADDENSKNSNEIIIKVSDDKVYFDDAIVKDESELKKKIEESSTDDMKYTLVEDNPILGTYNWVIKVLDESKIEYSTSSNVDEKR